MVGGQCHTLEMAFEELAIIIGQLLPRTARVEGMAQRCQDERLELGGGNAADQSGRLGLSLQHRLADVIAAAAALPLAAAWAPPGSRLPAQPPPPGPPP